MTKRTTKDQLDPTLEDQDNKGQPNGYCPLNNLGEALASGLFADSSATPAAAARSKFKNDQGEMWSAGLNASDNNYYITHDPGGTERLFFGINPTSGKMGFGLNAPLAPRTKFEFEELSQAATGGGSQIHTIRDNRITSGNLPNYVSAITRQNSDTESLYFGNNGNNNGVIAVNSSTLMIGQDNSGTFTSWVQLLSDGRFGTGPNLSTLNMGWKNTFTHTANALPSPTVIEGDNLISVFNSLSATDGEGCGIGFSHTTSAGMVGAAIVHEDTGTNSIGTLKIGVRTSSVGSTIPVAMTIGPNYVDIISSVGEFRVNGIKVLGAQQGAIANPDPAIFSNNAAIDSILTALRNLGCIAT